MTNTPHTPTPWSLFDKGPYGVVITPSKPGPDIAIIYTTGRWSAEWLANARRIVAAVNACDDVSSAALETGILREMRAALTRAEFLMRRVSEGDHRALENLLSAADQAHSAIARSMPG